MRYTIFGALLICGCTTVSTRDLETDKAIIRMNAGALDADYSLAEKEAQRVCGIHGKRAQFVSETCVNAYCTSADLLYACIE